MSKKGNTGKTEGSKATQFQPGVSGNPAGRQPDTALKELAKQKTDEAFEVVLTLMHKGRSERTRLQSAEIVLAYGHGRPRQGLDVDTSGAVNIGERLDAHAAYMKNRTPEEKADDEARDKRETAEAIQRVKGRIRAGLPGDSQQARIDRAAWRLEDMEGYSKAMKQERK